MSDYFKTFIRKWKMSKWFIFRNKKVYMYINIAFQIHTFDYRRIFLCFYKMCYLKLSFNINTVIINMFIDNVTLSLKFNSEVKISVNLYFCN